MNSRQKGARGEREFSQFLRECGYDARRGQQYCGADGSADVIGLPGVHIEVKRVESLNIQKAMEQSINDSRPRETPIVAHRKNREPWKVTMLAEDFIELYRAVSEVVGYREK